MRLDLLTLDPQPFGTGEAKQHEIFAALSPLDRISLRTHNCLDLLNLKNALHSNLHYYNYYIEIDNLIDEVSAELHYVLLAAVLTVVTRQCLLQLQHILSEACRIPLQYLIIN